MTKSVLYYSSSNEKPDFEKKIITHLQSVTGDLPIISVTQKPLDLGKNICVGEVGISYINEWKQILIGAKEATTDYLIMAESDFLYPPEYFKFEPSGENIYQYDNVWLMWLNNDPSAYMYPDFRRKKRSEGAQYVKRLYFIEILEKYLHNVTGWMVARPRHSPYRKQKLHQFHGDIPAISIKTSHGVTHYSGYITGSNVNYLPYWGDVNTLRERFL